MKNILVFCLLGIGLMAVVGRGHAEPESSHPGYWDCDPVTAKTYLSTDKTAFCVWREVADIVGVGSSENDSAVASANVTSGSGSTAASACPLTGNHINAERGRFREPPTTTTIYKFWTDTPQQPWCYLVGCETLAIVGADGPLTILQVIQDADAELCSVSFVEDGEACKAGTHIAVESEVIGPVQQAARSACEKEEKRKRHEMDVAESERAEQKHAQEAIRRVLQGKR